MAYVSVGFLDIQQEKPSVLSETPLRVSSSQMSYKDSWQLEKKNT